jgi:hypothetical protein
MAIQQLDYVNPPKPAGVLLSTFQDAIDLLNYCRTKPNYSCRVADRLDNTFEVQVEGVNIQTVTATKDQWIVLDGEHFYVLSQAEWSAKYKVAGT